MTENNSGSFLSKVLWFGVAMWMLSDVSIAKVTANWEMSDVTVNIHSFKEMNYEND